MRQAIVLLVALFAVLAAPAQQPPVQSPLLDHLAGHWVLRGTVHGQPTVHDVTAEWVISHHHVRIHEVSREKDASGQLYEAMVFVGWNDQSKTYNCVWIDTYGGVGNESIGIATPKENELPFVFKDDKGQDSFHNTFVYDPKSDTWEWILDNISNGVAKPFARFKLSRE